MTRQDYILKWLFFGLITLPIWWIEAFFFTRYPIFGTIPLLLPVAAALVSTMEGPLAGAGFGLAVGILCDAIYYGQHGLLTVGLPLLCWISGLLARYVLQRNFSSGFFCAILVVGGIDVGHLAHGLFTQLAPLPTLLQVSTREFLISVLFVLPLYPYYATLKTKIYHTLRIPG